MKKYIIRWALKQIKKLPNNVTYFTLEKYGIEDIVTNDKGEKMYLLASSQSN